MFDRGELNGKIIEVSVDDEGGPEFRQGCTELQELGADNGRDPHESSAAVGGREAHGREPEAACVGEWRSGDRLLMIVVCSGQLLLTNAPQDSDATKFRVAPASPAGEASWPMKWVVTRDKGGDKVIYTLEIATAAAQQLSLKIPGRNGAVVYTRAGVVPGGSAETTWLQD